MKGYIMDKTLIKGKFLAARKYPSIHKAQNLVYEEDTKKEWNMVHIISILHIKHVIILKHDVTWVLGLLFIQKSNIQVGPK